MKLKRILCFTAAGILFMLTVESCKTSKKPTTSKYSKPPKFISNISIAPHNKSNVTHNAIDPKKHAAKTHTTTTPHTTPPNPSKPVPIPASVKTTTKVDKQTPSAAIQRKYGEILGVTPSDIDNYQLYQFVDKWYGTNYRLGGTNNSGIDCSGFAQKLYSEVYGTDISRTSAEQFDECKRIKKLADVEEGDLVFFRIHSKRITHVGVFLANGYFVHSSTTGGVMISNLKEEYWRKYFAGFGRIPYE